MLHEFENIRVCIFKASNVEAYNLLIEQFPTFLNNLSYNQCLSLREFSKEFPGLNESSGKKKKKSSNEYENLPPPLPSYSFTNNSGEEFYKKISFNFVYTSISYIYFTFHPPLSLYSPITIARN